MMRVTIEIVPWGDEESKYTLHRADIVQVERHDHEVMGLRTYHYWLTRDGQPNYERQPDGWVTHRREDGALTLAWHVLDQEVGMD